MARETFRMSGNLPEWLGGLSACQETFPNGSGCLPHVRKPSRMTRGAFPGLSNLNRCVAHAFSVASIAVGFSRRVSKHTFCRALAQKYGAKALSILEALCPSVETDGNNCRLYNYLCRLDPYRMTGVSVLKVSFGGLTCIISYLQRALVASPRERGSG